MKVFIQISWYHSHKKQKHSNTGRIVDIFAWTWPYREYIKTAKNGSFWEEFLSENDFKAVLANFCCYDGANASEALQKISTGTLELYANSLK